MVDRYLMKKVFFKGCIVSVEMIEFESGDFVRLADYAALEKELAECKATLEGCKDTLDQTRASLAWAGEDLALVRAEVPCPECGGAGFLSKEMIGDIVVSTEHCPACKGTGLKYPPENT